MRVLIRYGRAESLRNVAEDIARVLKRNGVGAVTSRYLDVNGIRRGLYDKVIVVTVVDPLWSLDVAAMLSRFAAREPDRVIWYATVEGRFRPDIMLNPHFKMIRYVANSSFTEQVLREAGLEVVARVLHGVDDGKVEWALRFQQDSCKHIFSRKRDKAIAIVVASEVRRKGWPEFLDVVRRYVDEFRGRVTFYYISKPEVDKLVRKYRLEGVFRKIDTMGRLPHHAVLSFIACSDILVMPSLGEGFGLPVLEAMAVGTIPVVVDLPPYRDFLSPYSFKVPVARVESYIERHPSDSGQLFLLHHYRPEDMARAILEAAAMVTDKTDEYLEWRSENIEWAKRFYTSKVYKWFVGWARGWQ